MWEKEAAYTKGSLHVVEVAVLHHAHLLAALHPDIRVADVSSLTGEVLL